MPRHDPTRLRRARTLARLIGAVVGMVAGVLYGSFIVANSQGVLNDNTSVGFAAILASGVAGAASLALAGPLLSVDPYLWLERTLEEAPASELIGATAGMVLALLVSALIAILLSPLPWGIGFVVSVCLACALVYVGVRTGSRRRDAFAEALRRPPVVVSGGMPEVTDLEPQDGAPIVVDTSVLIDGRILDVSATGFIQGRLLIAGFVLEELQRVADSADSLKRARGRRGLQVVTDLKEQRHVECEFVDLDFPGVPEVDSRLVKLARRRHAAIMTNDFNLNRLARIEGVRVLNLNDLANALKPIVSAGETLDLTIVKEGKEPHQGVGYLDDGTMVVVEHGRDHLDEQVSATVTSVLQTAAGRMIFASLGGTGQHRADDGRPRRPQRPTRAGQS